ncbi:Condensin complex subunit [Thalictrum thalictroides]|uniref:Condensin-1 complex subunit CAP-D2 n=1 Tax=Thalictrum thalictroides TaxID=46969 RepID=A0A7J6W4U2_THATH|nr:Condensin complex subunit [Thalictrum thalictroides]
MAPPFIFPPNLESLEEEHEDNRLYVHSVTNITSFRSSQLEEFVKGVSFDLSNKDFYCIEDQDVFDRVYSLVRDFTKLTKSCKFNLVECLRSNFSVLLPNVDSLARISNEDEDTSSIIDRIASYRNAFKIYTYFLLSIVVAQESSTQTDNNNAKVGKGNRNKNSMNLWNWESQRGRIVNLVANSLESNIGLLFGTSNPDENYLSYVAKIGFYMFENPAMLKDLDTKGAICRIIGTCATKYHYIEQSCASVLHLIHKYDFVVTHLADAVAMAEEKYADGSLAVILIREIGRANPKDYVKDTVGADNVGRFLVELADRLPKLMSTNVGVLIDHFGGESYKIRNALVGVLGKLVSKAFKDIEGDVSSKSVRIRNKQAMLQIMLERCRDVSAYTRSRVLQVWGELCEEHAISIGLWNEVAKIAAGRLEDKSAIVRKSGLNLLISMLQHNPFGPQLRIASFEATLEKYRGKLCEQEPAVHSKSHLEGLPSDNDTCKADGEGDILEEHDISDSCLPCVEEGSTQKDSLVPNIDNSEQNRALVASLEAGLRFAKCLSETMPILVQLMASSSSTDVENTILLLMRCRQFEVDGSEACLRKMLPLVFSHDKSICDAVEDAFVTIYIRKRHSETAKNLLDLAIDSNIGDLAALEVIVASLVSKGEISTSTISALWDFFTFKINGVTAKQSRGALSILCMAAKSSTGIFHSHLQDIVDIGFGRWAKEEPLLARTACIALQRLSKEDKEILMASCGNRVFGILQGLISGLSLPEHIWYAAADKAISVIYDVHPAPESFAADLVKRSYRSVFDCSGGDELPNNFESVSTGINSTLHVAKLSRYLFVISHVALHQLVYIESCVKKIRKQKTKTNKCDADSQNVQEDWVTSADSLKKENGINAELGLAASEDAILDALSEKAEKEIVSGASVDKNLIGQCTPLLSKLCSNFSLMQKYPELHASAMIALCRFMIIDANFCEANLQLLFTVVENATSETVRSNCTIAVGDLAVRFPNLLEPWTENMYARLRDPSISVRRNAVLVLSHLILNDMMKVKGYINEMAVCLEDEDERISSLAKLFFHELSKKGSNPIYNLLPDILGRLCKQNLKKEVFNNIMQFLIGSIKKDKQMESLVEKLCNRFSGVTDIKQWEYISYCLSQLTFTERGMKKLMDSFKSYEHVLCEDSVMDNFKIIISKGKKFAKPELKSCIEEFEEKLLKFHVEKKEQEVTARNAQVHQQKVSSLDVLIESLEEGGVDDVQLYDSEAGEVIDPSIAEGTAQAMSGQSDARFQESEENSGVSSVLTELEDGLEVQSPKTCMTGAVKFKAKNISTATNAVLGSVKENASARSNTEEANDNNV